MGAGFGFVSHMLLDWAQFDSFYTNLFLWGLGGFIMQRCYPAQMTTAKTGVITGMAFFLGFEHIQRSSTISQSRLRIADADRTPEEAYRAR